MRRITVIVQVPDDIEVHDVTDPMELAGWKVLSASLMTKVTEKEINDLLQLITEIPDDVQPYKTADKLANQVKDMIYKAAIEGIRGVT